MRRWQTEGVKRTWFRSAREGGKMPDHGRGKGGKGLGKGGAKRHRKVLTKLLELFPQDLFKLSFPYHKLNGYKNDSIIFVVVQV